MNDAALIKLIVGGGMVITSVVARIMRLRSPLARMRKKLLAAPRTFEDDTVVSLFGTVTVLRDELTAPLSGRTCVAFVATARLDSKRSRAVDLEVVERVMTPFLLVTGDGEILVDGTDCLIPYRPAPVVRLLEREHAFLDRVAPGRASDAASAGFDELVVTAGMRVLVHGIARKQVAAAGDSEVGFRDAPMRRQVTGHSGPIVIDFD